MENQVLLTNLNSFKELAIANQWTITREVNGQFDVQLRVSDGKTELPVTFYTTGKANIQGKACDLRDTITAWWNGKWGATDSKTQPASNAGLSNPASERKARFSVNPNDSKELPVLLQSINATVKERTPLPSEHLVLHADISRSNERSVMSLYTNGTLLVQGKNNQLFDDICSTLDTKLGQSFADRATRFIPAKQIEEASELLNQPQSEVNARAWVAQQLNAEVYDFLPENDRKTYLAGAAILTTKLVLQDYSALVMPFARAYEGFIIQLALKLGIVTPIQIKDHPEEMRAGNFINSIQDRLSKSDKFRHGATVDTLRTTWTDIRHKVLHSDPVNPPYHTEFNHAENEIAAINRAMTKAYEVLVKRGIQLAPPPASSRATSQVQTQQTSVQTPTNKTSTPTRSGATGYSTKILISEPHIGLDESGKGDYFGPLVVSGVYIDKEIGERLLAIGVRDSKKLSDDAIARLAQQIKQICIHAIVPIGPERYNTLYDEIGRNLNRMLAWGHARSLDNVLKRIPCEIALADQFGDERFIQKALLKDARDRNIELRQQPRAEEDVAVAAASILARAEFVQRLKVLSDQCGHHLPKGASHPSIVPIGQALFKSGGRTGLGRYAKLHFRTTEKITQQG